MTKIKKVGRPKKTLDNLPKNWEEKVMELKKEGASDVEVRAELGISQDLWERFIGEIKEFSLTIKKGEDLCEAWWLGKGRKNLENKQFNAVLWYMNMKNRFGWKDKSEESGRLPVSTSTLNIFLTKNENILKVVEKTSEEIKKALHEEIEKND